MDRDQIGWTEIAAGAAILIAVANMVYVNGVGQELNTKIEEKTAENANEIAKNRQALIDQWPKPDLVLTDHHISVVGNKTCFEFELEDASVQDWWPSIIWYPYNGTYRQQNIGRMRMSNSKTEVCYYLDSWLDLNQIDWEKNHYITTTHQHPVFAYNLTITMEDRRSLQPDLPDARQEGDYYVWDGDDLRKNGDRE